MINRVDTNETNGTHLQGTIKTSYNNIVENFGKPELTKDADKVDCEWSIKFKDGTVATLIPLVQTISHVKLVINIQAGAPVRKD
mgnify:CR=1 FL=1